jgi:hypothetical protein
MSSPHNCTVSGLTTLPSLAGTRSEELANFGPLAGHLLTTLDRLTTAAEKIARSLMAFGDKAELLQGAGDTIPSSGVTVRGSLPTTDRPDLESIADSLRRLADHFVPVPAAMVGTPYVAKQLGCTTVWVAEMVRKGEIPKPCLVPGTGNGKPWKFHRERIDEWLQSR